LKIALYPDRFRDYYSLGFLVSTGLISRSEHQFIDPATQVLLLDCVSLFPGLHSLRRPRRNSEIQQQMDMVTTHDNPKIDRLMKLFLFS